MKKIEKIRAQVCEILEKLEEKAEKLDYWRTTVFFLNGVNGDLESRTVFAEHQVDAAQWAWDTHDHYRNLKIPHYVYSTAWDSNYDGGLYIADEINE